MPFSQISPSISRCLFGCWSWACLLHLVHKEQSKFLHLLHVIWGHLSLSCDSSCYFQRAISVRYVTLVQNMRKFYKYFNIDLYLKYNIYTNMWLQIDCFYLSGQIWVFVWLQNKYVIIHQSVLSTWNLTCLDFMDLFIQNWNSGVNL